MKRRKLAILLVAALLLQILPLPMGCLAQVSGIFRTSMAAEADGEVLSGTEGDISWQLVPEEKKDGWMLNGVTPYRLELSGTGDMKQYTTESYSVKNDKGETVYYTRTTAPWKMSISKIQTVVIGDGITNISNYAFYLGTSISSVEIPGSVKSIGNSAFYNCNALKKAVLPDDMESIGDYAFSNCTDMTEVNIPVSVTSIGTRAFYACSVLSSIEIPGSVEEIKPYTFYYCRNLKNAVVNEGVKSIGTDAFSYTGLVSFNVPASVTKMGVNPFTGGSLETITVSPDSQYFEGINGMLVEKKDSKLYKVISYPYNGAVTAVVPEPVEVIGNKAFYSSKLQSISLPGSLLDIEASAFEYSTKLSGIDVPGNVKKIGNRVFYNCYSLNNISLGGDILSIGSYAFAYCNSITGIVLPDKITSIGDNAFNGCSKLKELIFPNSITDIGNGVLAGCTVLERVSFGQQIKNISGNVFNGCPALAEIEISPKNQNLVAEGNIIYNKDKTKLVYYAAGMKGDKFMIPETVQSIGGYAFTYCTYLEELRFPVSVTVLEEYAVYHNSSISKLLFYGDSPKVSEAIKTDYDKGNLTSVVAYNSSILSNSVNNGKYDNSGLTIHKIKDSNGWEDSWTRTSKYKNYEQQYASIYKWEQNYLIPDWDPSKTDIATGSFDGLSWEYRDDIGEIVFSGEGKIPDFEEDSLPTWSNIEGTDHMQDIKLIETGNATEIGNNAFNGASKVVRIFSGNSLERVGQSAFANCTDLQVVGIQSAANIEKEAFIGDTAIRDDMDIRNCQTVGESAFKGCTSLTGILLGESLETIGKDTFALCSKIETMILPESLVSLGDGCFMGCSILRTINIPGNVTAVPALCFADCENLQKVYFYGDCPLTWQDDCFNGTHTDITIYYRSGNISWDSVGTSWNNIPVIGLDKFYTEQQDHYSFDNSSSSFGYGLQYFIPRQRYVTALQSIIRGSYYYAMDSEWRGSCFGMAASSTEFYEGEQFNVTDYNPLAENLYDVAAPGDSNADITKLIEIYQVSQYVDEIGMEIAGNFGKYKKLVNQVEEFERSGGLDIDSSADPLVMCLYSGCAGHAVVPVSVNMDSDGNYIFEVYDCNFPNGFTTLKVNKDLSGIEYGLYTAASFVRYSTIRDCLLNADFTGEYLNKEPFESNKVSIAVNRPEINLVNGGGRDYTEIEGAYEQRPMSDGTEDETSTLRSFVLPQGEYHIEDASVVKQGDGEEVVQEKLKYYIATEDLFSEIETSDKDAKLTVKSVTGEGRDTVTLLSEESGTESELTVMDVSGIKKEISVKGSSVTVDILNDMEMTLTVSDDATEVKVDGEELEMSGTQADISFCTQDKEKQMEISDMYCELSLDSDNQLSGMAEAYVTWANDSTEDMDVTARIKDGKGNVIAEYKENRTINMGLQKINLVLDRVQTDLGGLSGEFNAVCEIIITGSSEASVSYPGIILNATGTQDVVIPKPEAPATPTPEVPATSTPETTPTAKPQGGGSVIIFPYFTQTQSPSPSPAATQTPAATSTPSAAPVSVITPTPAVTQSPVATPVPEVTTAPEPDGATEPSEPDDSSVTLPDKGKVVNSGALKYIVVKPSDTNGTVSVYGAKNKNAKSVVIPKKININGYSYKVTGINKNAFNNMKKLSKVTIGANVKVIGTGAFKNCKKLQFIIIPSKVTNIGGKAFAGCSKLKYIVVKSGKIKSVGAGAFQGTGQKVTVKTLKSKWKKYSKMFTNKGKMSNKAVFLIEPAKLEYKGKSY